ncbi:MAG: XdhC family protein [Anaerolineae bacterium]|nr:XdhC family protein [Anaerolineae bacterium]
MNKDILDQAAAWIQGGQPVALATIVHVVGKSSQPLGARMAITSENRFVGAVSGGCVEGDVYAAAQAVLANGHALILHYKHVENSLVEIGLNCDGKIDVLVEPLDDHLLDMLTTPPTCLAVTLCTPGQPDAPDPVHALIHHADDTTTLPSDVIPDAQAAFDADTPISVSYPDGRVALFEPVQPPLTLLIFGGEQVAVPLVRFAKLMGFRTVVTDSRAAFATREKHPDADEVIAASPANVIAQVGADRRTFVVSLNHEPRFEDAMLHALADHPVRYIGAIGQRNRHEERVARAAAAGFDMNRLPTIYTPVGLNIGGKTTQEIALSIMAEIIAVKNGRRDGVLPAR